MSSYTYQKTVEYKFDASFVQKVLNNKYYFSFGVPVNEHGYEISRKLEKKIKKKIKRELIKQGLIKSNQMVDIVLTSGSLSSVYLHMIPMIAYARWIEEVVIDDGEVAGKKIRLFLE